MSYIEYSDITDGVATAFGETVVSPYITECDEALESMAQEHGITDATDIIAPLHYTVRRWAICFVCYRLFEDKAGINNVTTPAYEKYYHKADFYKKRADEYRRQITRAMLTDTIAAADDVTPSFGEMQRG